jgi:hypothetical protein
VDVREKRLLENAKARVVRALERAIGTSMAKLLEPQYLAFQDLELHQDGSRVIVPTRNVPASDFLQRSLQANYRDVVDVAGAADGPLKKLLPNKPEILLMFGDTLPNNYFFSGTYKLVLDFAKPAASTVGLDIHIFAKRGKKMGAQLKISQSHDVGGNGFVCKVDVDFPIVNKEA